MTISVYLTHFCTVFAVLTLHGFDITSLLQCFYRLLPTATLTKMSNILCLIARHSKLPFKTVVLNNWKQAGIFLIHVFYSS